jgi:hypothetical protein
MKCPEGSIIERETDRAGLGAATDLSESRPVGTPLGQVVHAEKYVEHSLRLALRRRGQQEYNRMTTAGTAGEQQAEDGLATG